MFLLEHSEKSQKNNIKKQRDQMLLQDYMHAFGDFMDDNEILHWKVGNYDKVQLTKWYKGNNNMIGSMSQ